jgi:hypothetical protein
MHIKPLPHLTIEQPQLNTLLVNARQSGCATEALKNYFEWHWQVLCAAIPASTGEKLTRLQGAMELIKVQYELLFADLKGLQSKEQPTRSKP